jgi:hypothetical protein
MNKLLENFSIEELANAVYVKMEQQGFQKGTDKTKWREVVMADRLGHQAHDKISAGANSDKYGSDALDANGIYAEYKSKAITEKQIRNLLQLPKNKKGARYAPLVINGVYNGAYTMEAIEKYSKIDHYFGVFYKEELVLVVKVDRDEVKKQLTKGFDAMEIKRLAGKKYTTNCNTVSVNMSDVDKCTIVYKNFKNLEE